MVSRNFERRITIFDTTPGKHSRRFGQNAGHAVPLEPQSEPDLFARIHSLVVENPAKVTSLLRRYFIGLKGEDRDVIGAYQRFSNTQSAIILARHRDAAEPNGVIPLIQTVIGNLEKPDNRKALVEFFPFTQIGRELSEHHGEAVSAMLYSDEQREAFEALMTGRRHSQLVRGCE